jgi:2-oxoisovalerate dehydrogenase E1 component
MVSEEKEIKKINGVAEDIALKAFELMCTAKSMTEIYENNKEVTAKYVHATSRGHEAIQIATGMQLKPQDFVSPYYRDDSLLLAMGLTPYQLMLQLLAKKDDPFSGGRLYYSHPSLKDEDKPKIPMQSSATGMQAIPSTGIAMGMQYKEKVMPETVKGEKGVVVCSLGDASVTEGEVAEAFQMAVLKKLPIIFLVQDNGWDISASAEEVRAQNAAEYAKGFKGLETKSIDGTDFFKCYNTLEEVIAIVRTERRPFLIHATVPLLNHHTSGVRKEWYRDDLEEAQKRDPHKKLYNQLLIDGFDTKSLKKIEDTSAFKVLSDFNNAIKADDPNPEDLFKHDFAPSPILEEKGKREGDGKEKTMMVDAALFAIQELMAENNECLLYGQDVGKRLGGVFREAATLAQKFGDDRVFNTPIQEAFIIGSTVGMSAVGLKPIVEVQFADYIWPGLNQLFTEVSRSCYLSNGKWPVSCIIRVPIGAYGSGGPYHSSSVESVLTNIKGIKIAYPSNAADLKGLMKAAYYDPNPVVMLEHKGLYWSKIKGTEDAKTIEPDSDYIIPFGKANKLVSADTTIKNTLTIVTYGMGVYWAKTAEQDFKGQLNIIDLRTLFPLDEELIYETVKNSGKCLVVTEEPESNSFAQSLASKISYNCFKYLDAPVTVIGAENLPAIPLNAVLESTMLPNAEKVKNAIKKLLEF